MSKKISNKQIDQELEQQRQILSGMEAIDNSNNKVKNNSNQRFADCIDDIKDGLIELNLIGNILDVNKAAVDIFGGTREELIGKHFTKIGIFSTKEIPKLLIDFKNIVIGKKVDSAIQINNKSGRQYYLDCSISLKIRNKIPVGVIVVAKDVTEHKLAEAALSQEKLKLGDLISHMNSGMLLLDDQTKVIYANEKAREWFGNIEDIKGLMCCDLFEMKDSETECVGLQVIKTKETAQGNIFKKEINGSQKYFYVIASPTLDGNGNVTQVTEIIVDLTKIKNAEASLQVSEEKYKQLFESETDAILLFDADTRQFVDVNNAAVKLYGYSKEEFLKLKHQDITDEIEASNESIEKTLNGELSRIPVRYHKKKDGTIFPVEISSSTLELKGQKVLCGIVRDISERKEAEEILRNSEEFNRAVIESSPLGISVRSPQGKLLSVNEAWKKIWAVSEDKIREYLASNPKELKFDKKDSYLGDWQSKIKKVYEEGGMLQIPELYLANHRSAKPRWVSQTFYAVMDSNNKVSRVVIITNDITKRKLVEEQLQFTSQITEQVTDSIITTDLDFKITYTNQAFTDLFGYPKDEMLGKSPGDLNAEENAEEIQNKIYQKMSAGKTWKGELLNKKKDGSVFPCELILYPMVNEKGEIFAYAGNQRDITERKKAEEALRESEDRFKKLFDNAPVGYQSLDVDGNFLEVNETWCEILGYSRDEVIGKCFSEFFAPDYKDLFEICFPKFKEAGLLRGLEHTLIKKDGTQIIASFDGKIAYNEDGSFKQTHCIFVDVTERKKVEDALRDSEEQYRNLVETSQDLIWKCDAEGNFIYLNPAWEKTHGYEIEEMLGRPFTDFQTPEVAARDVEEFGRHITGGAITGYETTQITKSGKTIHLIFNAIPLFDNDGNILGTQGTAYDITESKKAEKALQESEKKFRTYIANAPDAIFITDSQGRFVDVNAAACQLTGYSEFELLNMSIPKLTNPRRLLKALGSYNKLKTSGKVSMETTMNYKDGSIVDISLDAVALSEDRFMAFCSDITETRRLQELESRAQRLETAGQIAGQVAHDFNNLLAPLLAYPEFIREELSNNHPALPYLRDIEKSTIQIAEINQQLLTLGRRGHYNQEPVNLNDVILETIRELKPLPDTLVCETKLCNDLMNIMAGRAQIHRVLVNLIQNARDAMQDIGRLTIITENFYVDDVSVEYGRVPKGEFIKLTISDTGHGISNDSIQKIFDPFFTTKTTDKQRGSGLGLSVVNAVVNDHHGYVDLKSKIGKGTSFYLYFPVTRETSDGEKATDIIGGNETVLIVDDDQIQREVSFKLLKKLGYKTSVVESGEKAIEFLKQKPQDLMVLDMIMPDGIDGTETYKRVLEINHDQKVIIVSGFAESERVQTALEMGAGAFVRKPLTRKILANAVRKELDNK